MAETVRVRFAPSPTGYLHVGGVRTALFNWLWAKHNKGEFHIRIEDTDQKRLVKDAEQQIIDSLAWLGLTTEHPIVHQSDRLEKYRLYADQLIKDGHAYQADEPRGSVTRFKWPEGQTGASFKDALRGEVQVPGKDQVPSAYEDFVLIKADGFPTYNFANVIDDHEMEITHVIRGDEFIASTHRHVALYEAFDWKPPVFVHVPPIVEPGGKPLSKRYGARSILSYREAGYLPMALNNFLALIGWSPGKDRELFFSLDELAEAFSLEGLQKSPGAFDEQKLEWMNGEHLKNLDPAELLDTAKKSGFWKAGKGKEADYDAAVISLAAERAKTLADLADIRDSYFYHRPKVGKKDLVGSENPGTIAVWLEQVQRALGALPKWESAKIENVLTDVREELSLTPKQLYPVLRIAVTNAPKTPALWDVFGVLGKEETLARLEAAASLVS